MRIVKLLLKFPLVALFVGSGVMHFARPEFFLAIMPPYLPWHLPLVYLSGLFEIALGALLLVPATTQLAAWGLIALLIAVFPANIYLYQHQEIMPNASPTVHLLRLPLQGVLIVWVWWYTRGGKENARVEN